MIDIADYFLEHKKWQDFRDETWSKLFDALKKFGANQQNRSQNQEAELEKLEQENQDYMMLAKEAKANNSRMARDISGMKKENSNLNREVHNPMITLEDLQTENDQLILDNN